MRVQRLIKHLHLHSLWAKITCFLTVSCLTPETLEFDKPLSNLLRSKSPG